MEKPKIEYFNPELQLVIDKDRDVDVFFAFWRGEKSIHPGLDDVLKIESEELARKKVQLFVDEFYSSNSEKVKANFKNTTKEWGERQDYFFQMVEQMFKGFPWPSGSDDDAGKYSGVASIWTTFPRFIKGKWFTFPVNPNYQFNPKKVIAHEMLHFMEYEYMEKKFGLKPSESKDKDNTFYQFTENLNTLIENENFWEVFTDGEKSVPKKGCEKLYVRMKEIWDKKKDVDNLIREIFGV